MDCFTSREREVLSQRGPAAQAHWALIPQTASALEAKHAIRPPFIRLWFSFRDYIKKAIVIILFIRKFRVEFICPYPYKRDPIPSPARLFTLIDQSQEGGRVGSPASYYHSFLLCLLQCPHLEMRLASSLNLSEPLCTHSLLD
jgi:hypothetical protein